MLKIKSVFNFFRLKRHEIIKSFVFSPIIFIVLALIVYEVSYFLKSQIGMYVLKDLLWVAIIGILLSVLTLLGPSEETTKSTLKKYFKDIYPLGLLIIIIKIIEFIVGKFSLQQLSSSIYSFTIILVISFFMSYSIYSYTKKYLNSTLKKNGLGGFIIIIAIPILITLLNIASEIK